MSSLNLKNLSTLSATLLQQKEKGTPLVLGITGGIACGKSLVVSQFQALGAAVVSADSLAREAVARGSLTLQRIVSHFGSEVLNQDGELDRLTLARRIFSDREGRAALNRIIHPVIGKLAEKRLREFVNRGETRLVVYEAPLLFEAQAEKRVDLVLVVVSSEETQIERLMQRNHLTREEACQRIQAQMPLAEKVARADILLDNSGTPEDTAVIVRELFSALALPEKNNPPSPEDH